VLYLWSIILLVKGDVLINSETLLVTDFVNFNIKLAQSFRCAHKDKMYVYVFIRMSVCTYMSICIYTIFLKREKKCVMIRVAKEKKKETNDITHHLRRRGPVARPPSLSTCVVPLHPSPSCRSLPSVSSPPLWTGW
jgi:hypothetical protein